MDTGNQQRDNGGCATIEDLIDAYVSNELEGDTAEKVVRHAGECAACAQAIDERVRIRVALRRAVGSQEGATDELRNRIHGMLSDESSRRPGRYPWWIAVAAGALLVVGAGLWTVSRLGGAPGGNAPHVVAEGPSQPSVQMLQVGLAHHVHCVNMVPPPDVPRTDDDMQQRLGDEYAGLVAAVRSHLPAGYTIVDAHRCSSQNRKYLHIVARDGSDIVSFLVTARTEGPLEGADLAEGVGETAITPASLVTDDVKVTGFETPRYYVYVVTGARSIDTAQLASAIGPSVRDYLATRS